MFRKGIICCAVARCSSQQRMNRLDRALLVSVAVLLLCSTTASARRGNSLVWRSRQLQQGSPVTASPPPLNATSPANASPPLPATPVNATPPASLASPPPPEGKEKLQDKFKHLGDGKSPAEKGIAITVGVLMLVSILTCLVCCVFRRGGQWRVPGLAWFKKKFGPKDRYSRYMDSQDDGF